MSLNNLSYKKIFLATGLLIALMLVIYFILWGISGNATKQLEGVWSRSDGPYKIEIKEAKEDGILDAAYFNPNPINVGRAGWRMHEQILQIYVELKDENYPGSIYQLTYDNETETETLSGTYYQALTRQTYEVKFTKNN